MDLLINFISETFRGEEKNVFSPTIHSHGGQKQLERGKGGGILYVPGRDTKKPLTETLLRRGRIWSS